MIKTCCIIDGNYLLYKDVFILKKSRSINEDLIALMSRDYDKITKSYPFDKIYFVSDRGKSWRKEFLDIEYKGTRKKDETIDWDFVFKEYDDFKQSISNNPRCNLIEVDGLEGDDILAYIVKQSNKQGYTNMIVSSDADIQQLIHYDIEKNYINVMWNYKFNDQRVYVPENYKIFLDGLNGDSNDIFSLSNEDEFVNYLEQLIMNTKLKEVNDEKSLFCKIVSGDSGDNVKGVMKVKNGVWDDENGRGIGDIGAEKCYDIYKEMYPDNIDFKSKQFVERCKDVAIYYKKITNQEVSNKVTENITMNIQLVYLDEWVLPEILLEKMKMRLPEFKSEEEKDDFWDF